MNNKRGGANTLLDVDEITLEKLINKPQQPVVITDEGKYYFEESIRDWLKNNDKDPISKSRIRYLKSVPNKYLTGDFSVIPKNEITNLKMVWPDDHELISKEKYNLYNKLYNEIDSDNSSEIKKQEEEESERKRKRQLQREEEKIEQNSILNLFNNNFNKKKSRKSRKFRKSKNIRKSRKSKNIRKSRKSKNIRKIKKSRRRN